MNRSATETGRERRKGSWGRIWRRVLRGGMWAGVVLGVVAVVATWVWWRAEPRAEQGSQGVNGLWARHQWVGEAHSAQEYRALADTLPRGEISDVFFHVGPLDPDGSIPPSRYAHARELLGALERLAPGVRAQAYIGQVTRQGAGPLDLTRRDVRDRIVATARGFLELGFDGIHYDIEPVYPDDDEFLDLLGRTHDLTTRRGGVLSVSLEQLELVNGTQAVAAAVLPDVHYPPRPTRTFLEGVASRVDQVAIMAYDTELPADWLVGWHFAWQAEHVTKLIGDQVTLLVGVPTYAQGQPFPWAENLNGAPVLRRALRSRSLLGWMTPRGGGSPPICLSP